MIMDGSIDQERGLDVDLEDRIRKAFGSETVTDEISIL